jgi:hypothetical protein
MSRVDGGLSIVLPVKAGRFRWLLDLIWLGVWVVVEGALIAGLAGARILPRSGPSLVVPLLFFTAAGLFLLYRCLWYWAGRERYVARSDRLLVRREILGLGRERVFPKEEIADLYAQRLKYRMVYPSWGRMFVGNGNGEIVIEASGRRHVFGKGLEVDEAEHLAELLRAELAGRSRQRRPTEFRLR